MPSASGKIYYCMILRMMDDLTKKSPASINNQWRTDSTPRTSLNLLADEPLWLARTDETLTALLHTYPNGPTLIQIFDKLKKQEPLPTAMSKSAWELLRSLIDGGNDQESILLCALLSRSPSAPAVALPPESVGPGSLTPASSGLDSLSLTNIGGLPLDVDIINDDIIDVDVTKDHKDKKTKSTKKKSSTKSLKRKS